MSDMLSQEEINALLGETTTEGDNSSEQDDKFNLTNEQKDVLGEVGNISMGTAATTLFALLNHKVEISTPTVSMVDIKKLSAKYDRPCVGLKISYKEGLVGANLLILKQEDVKIIANLMMGGDGTINSEEELTELDLSAISEAMNQMVGSSSTSLSSMLGYKIDIDTPQAFVLTFEDDDFFQNSDLGGDVLVCNSFRMVVGELIDSEIMQLLPMEFAESIINQLHTNKDDNVNETAKETPAPAAPAPQQITQPVQNIPTSASIPMQQAQSTNVIQNNVNVQPAQFQNFDINELVQQKENITIIRDVPLEVTVELGRTRKTIKEILEFNPGTVIELDKIAGEPVDILVNGKFVAKGEVVVIDENFGVRITDIINIDERI
ncbi:MAG: flagellar motor switch phosphatase FliY [Eubacteriales bacterium]|nr:flagellar motor switch phosphatase FliY [Eubacteriales bacterium]